MIEIRLLEECNYKCVFCHIPQLKPKTLKFEEVLLLLRSYDHKNATRIVITGWEPTMVPYLEKLFKVIKKLNNNHIIYLQTNWILFSNYNFLQKLINAWLDEILLSFHSHTEEWYEKITGVKWSYLKMLNALDNLNKTNLKIEISFVISNYNYKEICENFVFLDSKIKFYWVTIANIFEKINYKKHNNFIINISKIKPYLLKALLFLKDKKKNIINCWVPMCYLEWFEESYMIWQYEEDRYFKKDNKCIECKVNKYCRWLIWAYADLFWTSELSIVKKIDKNKLIVLENNKNKYFKWIEFNNSTT